MESLKAGRDSAIYEIYFLDKIGLFLLVCVSYAICLPPYHQQLTFECLVLVK